MRALNSCSFRGEYIFIVCIDHWSLIFGGRHCLTVFRKIFGSERREVVGDWRKLLNVELHDLYSTLNIIRAIK